MAKNNMSQRVRDEIFDAVYKKADEFGYMLCDRVQSGRFMAAGHLPLLPDSRRSVLPWSPGRWH